MNKKTLDHIEIINNLMAHEDWYQKDVYELLQQGVDITANAGVSLGLKTGATAVAGAKAQATVVNSIALSTAAFAAPVVGGVAGLWTLYAIARKITDIYVNEQRYIKEVADQADRALKNIIIYCFKNEACSDKDEDDVLNLKVNFNEYRKNKAFLAWIDLQTFKIMGEEYVGSNGLLKKEDELSEEEKQKQELEDAKNKRILEKAKKQIIELNESLKNKTDEDEIEAIELYIKANKKVIQDLEQETLINIKCAIQREYERKINKYIKPDQRKRFEEEMQIFCAANKILADCKYNKGLNFEPSLECAGEFSRSKANSSSPFFSR